MGHKVDHSPSHRHDCSLLPLAYGRVEDEDMEYKAERDLGLKQGLGGTTCLRSESVDQVLFLHTQPQF